MNQPIGTCSECGGPVVLPNMMIHPVPCCQRCGAQAKHPYGPVVPMEPPSKRASVYVDGVPLDVWNQQRGQL